MFAEETGLECELAQNEILVVGFTQASLELANAQLERGQWPMVIPCECVKQVVHHQERIGVSNSPVLRVKIN